ncbi:NAD(P)H-dependent oxidoreductase [uncultured Aquimarina sp.]|uniref:NAD(P)H-dependent oxidoreductase n=1 Tax=uncultured Aquimarina sp. TaxID=575652 RepID=UPI00260630D2|nr:NAD(P)H-dependent oxidoreductase [uncultured Aquimarina sp.]
MKNTLIIIAHPSYKDSLANKTIVEALEEEVENCTIRNLSELYPDFNIDVKKEQDALLKADHVIFQFPFYWYSIPPILKQWIDVVLTYGFAYGDGGDKLKGKSFIVSTTTGTPVEAYKSNGMNRHTMEEFLYPIKQTATLCLMDYKNPVYSHAMIAWKDEDRITVINKAKDQANRLLLLVS